MRAVRRLLVTIAALALACGRADAPAARPGPDGLAASLDASLAAIRDEPARAGAIVASWRIPEPAWTALVTDAYRAHWRDYAAAFDAAAPALAARLAALARTRGGVRAQWQYADDPALTGAQIRVRWILPVGQPGVVAWVSGERIDLVFVWDGAAWRALAGADDMIQSAVRAQRPDCLPTLAAAGPAGRCTSIAWMIADAAMRAQPDRLARACVIAAANGCAPRP